MSIKNSLASVAVKDLNAAVPWYERLFGRPADSRQVTGVAEWKFERGGWLQVYQGAARAGSGSFTLTVSSLDELVSDLEKCGLDAGRQMISEKMKVVMLKDPDGNSIAFVEALDSVPYARISRLIRAYFDAYEAKDRAALDRLLHEDFTFGSPQDPHLDRVAYFERCWPNSQNTNSFAIQKLIEEHDEAFVLYTCEPKDGAAFSNTVYIRVDSGKVREVRVFYGSLPKNEPPNDVRDAGP